MPRHFTHLLTLFLMATLGGLAQPSGKLARDLPVQGTEKVDVIIQFNNPPGQQDRDQVRGQGGELKRQLPAINGALSVEVASAVWGTRRCGADYTRRRFHDRQLRQEAERQQQFYEQLRYRQLGGSGCDFGRSERDDPC